MSVLTHDVDDRDHVRGPHDAPVTLVEYGDFQCPHCRRAAPIVEELAQRFPDQLRIVFRHFPLSEVHPLARAAAEASEAAAAQGRFWEMERLLFQRQPEFERQHLLEYASELGLDVKRVARELDDERYAGRIDADVLSGVRSGVNGTPTFFLNRRRFDEPWDLEHLERAIALAAAAHA